jgi:archaemetzincin
MRTLRMVVVGDGVPLEARDRMAGSLAQVFGYACKVAAEPLDPDGAFDPVRNQYHSTRLLEQLARIEVDSDSRVLGITGLDLYVPVLTFVFGEAQLTGPCALVSCHRLRDEFYGLPPRPDLLEERLVKEAMHELGHTYGLRHCQNWECVMASTHSVERLDLKKPEFCPACRKVIRATS